MSKSKFNTINPDDVIEKYGADCFRMFEMFLGPLDQSKPWDDKGIDGVSKFIRRFWRLFYDEKGNWRVTGNTNTVLIPNPSPEEKGTNTGEPFFMTGDAKHSANIKYALDNRKNPTPAEEKLWQELRDQKTGVKFRRQHLIDTYIVDFVALSKGLIIEIDGASHDFTKDDDTIRTTKLNEIGYSVIRFTNDEVESDIQKVISSIKEKMNSLPDYPPLHKANDSQQQAAISPLQGRGAGGEDISSIPTDAEYKVLHKTLKKISEDIERLQFNTCVSQFMICLNELNELKCTKRAILEPLLIALAPFAPFVTEELWAALGNTGSIHQATFPAIEEKYLVESAFTYPVSINGKVRANLAFALDMSEAEVKAAVIANEVVQKWLNGGEPKKFIFVKGRIINVVI